MSFSARWTLTYRRRDGKLAFGASTFPPDALGSPSIDPNLSGLNDLVGWGTNSPITAYFPDLDPNATSIATWLDISQSENANSPVVILDTTTGERVPHFGELDFVSGTDEQALLVWPNTQLKWDTRYIVAFRGLVDTAGRAIQPTEAFRALRDNLASQDPDVNERRSHFEDIFSTLAANGVVRNSLVSAWDFTTGTRSSITGRLVSMRDDALRRVDQAGGIQFSISQVEENPSQDIARRFVVTMQVPQYVDKQAPGAHLVLNAQGLPVYQGLAPADFLVQVPNSLASGERNDGAIMQYGHGLFGGYGEARNGYLGAQANANGWVIAAADWIGMAGEDVVDIGLMLLTNITNFRIIPDRGSQGMVRALMVMHLLKDPRFAAAPEMTFNGRPALPANPRGYYYGNSQGGILGGVYMGVTTEVTRGCLGVPGGPYGIMLTRSKDFDVLFEFIKARFPNAIDRVHLLAVMQLLWDRAEPSGYLDAIQRNPLPNTPRHSVLIQHALGDQQVTHLSAHHMGRSIGAVRFESTVAEPGERIFGFEVVPDSFVVEETSVLNSWYYPEAPPIPFVNLPPREGPDTHEGPRREPLAIDQMYEFFETGKISNTCDGLCVGSRKLLEEQQEETPAAKRVDVGHKAFAPHLAAFASA